EARALEPQLACVAALESPSTGIVDSHAFMLGLRGDAEAHGAAIAFRSPLLAGHIENGAIELEVGGRERLRLLARAVVNSAGLFAQDVARSIEGFPAERIPPAHYCKGNYFSLSGRSPFSRLVYPAAPEAASLGVHLTLDLPARRVSVPTSNGSSESTMTSTRSARRFFTRPYAATGRALRTAPCSPRIPESGPSSRRAASPRAISSSRGRPTTASRASSICSASSLRA